MFHCNSSVYDPLKSRQSIACFIALVCIGLSWFSPFLLLRINLTGSMPRGIYWIQPTGHLQRGDLVAVCLPKQWAQLALHRGYLKPGGCAVGSQPALKEIVAASGDTVHLSDAFITVNRHRLAHSATLFYDSHHRVLPAVTRGTYHLKPHQLWLYGTESLFSWDSRYFGSVNDQEVLFVVKPLWIFSHGLAI